jgi:hypothetical protein
MLRYGCRSVHRPSPPLRKGRDPESLPFLSYRVYASLEIGEIGGNPPKSPLKRGTKNLVPCQLRRQCGKSPPRRGAQRAGWVDLRPNPNQTEIRAYFCCFNLDLIRTPKPKAVSVPKNVNGSGTAVG